MSAVGTAIGLACLGVFSHLKLTGYDLNEFGWIPIASFSFIIFMANWGIVAIPFLVISEIMPEKVCISPTI